MSDILHLIADGQPNTVWPHDSAIYLAGPVTDIKDYNAAVFAEARSLLLAHGYSKILDPVAATEEHDSYYNIPRGSDSWTNYMRIGISLLMKAETVILLPGWAQSRGAMAELTLATSLEMGVYLMFPQQKLLIQTSRPKSESTGRHSIITS